MTQKKFGLVLGSGAGRGLFHLGVIKSLEKNGLKADIVTGASIGAIVGAMYASGMGYQEIYDQVFTKKSKRQVLASFLDLTIFKGGILDGKKFKRTLRTWLPKEKFKHIEDLKIPFGLVATDIVSGEKLNLTKGNLLRALRASSSVPLMFQPVKYKEYMLIDGGVSDPVPVELAKAMGAELTVAVNLDATTQFCGKSKKFKLSANVAMRAFNLYKHKIAELSMQAADIALNPDLSTSGVIALDSFVFEKKAKLMIEQGEAMMDSRIEELKDLLNS